MGLPSIQDSILRSTISAVNGGGTQRSSRTSTADRAAVQSSNLNERRSRERSM